MQNETERKLEEIIKKYGPRRAHSINLGEGEKSLRNLMKYCERYNDFTKSCSELKKTKGIAFIDTENNFIFTGFEKQLSAEELPRPNYDLLAKHPDINNCCLFDTGIDALAIGDFLIEK